MIETPCRNLCSVHRQAPFCTGCGRTMEEIAAWVRMSSAERLAIMAELPARLARWNERP